MTKKSGVAILLALLATLATTLIGTPAQADSFRQIPNYGNRKCLDVQTQNDYFVQLWNCTGHAEQQWSQTFGPGVDNLGRAFLHLTNSRTRVCLGVDNNSTFQRARVVSLPCENVSTVWVISYANNENFDGWHQQLKNQNSGLCLDLQGNNSANGTLIWLWPCTDQLSTFNPAQLWML